MNALTVSGANFFAGSYGGGVYLSYNDGTDWSKINTGLTNPYIRSFGVSGTNLFAGTTLGGMFL